MQIVEANQVDILAFPVPRDLQQIGEAEETGVSGEVGRNLRKLDGLDGVDLDLAIVHTVTGTDSYVRTTPNENAAGNLSPTDAFAKTFGEDHAKSLHPVGWNARSADGMRSDDCRTGSRLLVRTSAWLESNPAGHAQLDLGSQGDF